MLPETKEQITKHFQSLMNSCDVDVLLKHLREHQVFSQNELDDIFSTSDTKHNKRIFFFELQKKPQRTFPILLEALKVTKQHYFAELLQIKPNEKVFKTPNDSSEMSDEDMPRTPLSKDTQMVFPLSLKVVPSEKFWDTTSDNPVIPVYNTRSKKRGRALIINNYDFPGVNAEKDYRNGADVDSKNLKELFRQMGGWDVVFRENQTANEMSRTIKEFSQDESNIYYDVCFLIIMSHGNEHNNETIIYGTNHKYITVSSILADFSNMHCPSFKGKPKIFLFQVCRGLELHQRMRESTEVDSRERSGCLLTNFATNYRYQEDMLIGYATLPGSKAHRNSVRGSWYIELLCEVFMKFSNNTPVNDLLVLVDQDLKHRISEWNTVQTSEHNNIGFKRLYLNPGIYEEKDGDKEVLKSFS